jgi:hypothetical protein
MIIKHLNRSFGWVTAFLSCFSMTTSTLAAGKEAERINQQEIQAYIQELHLNKKQNWSEFYENTKDYYPAEVAAKFQEFAKLNPGLQLPEVHLKSAQNTNGEQVPVLEIFTNGKTHSIQIIGEDEKWAKYDGIVLSKSDIENPANALTRLQTANINFRNEGNAYFAKHNVLSDQKAVALKSDLSRFAGFPRMTPQLWSTLTNSQRKDFIAQILNVWHYADLVNGSKKTKKSVKTSLLQKFLERLILTNAFAEDSTGPSYENAQNKTRQDLEAFLSSDPKLLESFKSGVWTPELDNQLVKFEISAEQEANESIKICNDSVSETTMDSPEIQRSACEQFHQALLINEKFIAPMRATSCRSPAQYIGLYSNNDTAAVRAEKDQVNRSEIHPDKDFLCSCDANGSKKVKFNESCEAVKATVQDAQAAVADSAPYYLDTTPPPAKKKAAAYGR